MTGCGVADGECAPDDGDFVLVLGGVGAPVTLCWAVTVCWGLGWPWKAGLRITSKPSRAPMIATATEAISAIVEERRDPPWPRPSEDTQ